jgi:hypothetical protein
MDEKQEIMYHRPSDFCPAAFFPDVPPFSTGLSVFMRSAQADQLSEFLGEAVRQLLMLDRGARRRPELKLLNTDFNADRCGVFPAV